MIRIPRITAAALLVLLLSCTASPQSGPAPAAGGAVSVPLASPDPDALAKAENELRRATREQAGLAKLGPGALEFATTMDRAASFLVTQVPSKVSASIAGGRLAARLPGLPPPGATVVGVYAMTAVLFPQMVSDQSSYLNSESSKTDTSPTTKSATLDPSTDEVTVEGNKGTITTTISFTASKVKSKISLEIKMKQEGEVRDAKTGAVIYKISSEATGKSDGDFCPDTAGIAKATMNFTGQESYFDSAGAKTGTADRSFGGQVRYKADDNAKLVSTEIAGGSVMGEVMLRTAAQAAAGPYEKGWRSGACIEVLVDPSDRDVDAGSTTNVTAKLRHKTEGNDLDKTVEAKMSSGTKSIEPSGQKLKAPASFKFTAGQSGEKGTVTFDSTSNRGIGHASATYTVSGGWVVNATGTSRERTQGGTGVVGQIDDNFKVTIKDLKIKAGKDGALEGTGTMTIAGPATFTSAVVPGSTCKGNLDQTLPITARGSVAGSGPTAVLKLTLQTAGPLDATVSVTCSIPGVPTTITGPFPAGLHSDYFGLALGEIELPAEGGTKTITKTNDLQTLKVDASATFTVTKAKS